MLHLLLSSGILGFITSLVTPFVRGYQDRKNKLIEIRENRIANDHEIRMLQLSIQNQKELQAMKLEETRIASDLDITKTGMQIDLAAQKNLYTGSSKMDAFISSVRPVTTYAFTATFLVILWFYCFSVISHASTTAMGLKEFLSADFVLGMNYLFANIITFWFGNRMLDKRLIPSSNQR